MSKILFSLLVSGVFFGGIPCAMAVRTMNAEKGPQKISVKKATFVDQAKIEKPTPHGTRKQETQNVSRDFEKLVQYAADELNSLKASEKENKQRIDRGYKKFSINPQGTFLMDRNGNFLPCKIVRNKALHEVLL